MTELDNQKQPSDPIQQAAPVQPSGAAGLTGTAGLSGTAGPSGTAVLPGSVRPSLAVLRLGDRIPDASYPITRERLIRYAGASGDFNPIHWNARVAIEVGLPDVIAHGMLTMATAGRAVTDWVGDPAAIVEYSVRFTRTVAVPDDGVGATVEVSGVVAELDPVARTARIDLTVRAAGVTVLGKARAVVRLD